MKKKPCGIFGKLADEDGNTVIEATFIVTLTIIMLFLLMMIGMVFYQETLLQSTADEVAAKLARTYSYSKKDPITGYIGKDDMKDLGLISGAYYLNVDGSEQTSTAKSTGMELIKKLLGQRRLMSCKQTKQDDYTVEVKKNDSVLFQCEIKVTIKERYYIPFASLIGIEDSLIEKSCTGKAICYDLLSAQSYYSTLNTVAQNLNKNVAILDMVESVVTILENIGNSTSNIYKTIIGWSEN